MLLTLEECSNLNSSLKSVEKGVNIHLGYCNRKVVYRHCGSTHENIGLEFYWTYPRVNFSVIADFLRVRGTEKGAGSTQTDLCDTGVIADKEVRCVAKVSQCATTKVVNMLERVDWHGATQAKLLESCVRKARRTSDWVGAW